jgi:hypothetical protein
MFFFFFSSILFENGLQIAKQYEHGQVISTSQVQDKNKGPHHV